MAVVWHLLASWSHAVAFFCLGLCYCSKACGRPYPYPYAHAHAYSNLFFLFFPLSSWLSVMDAWVRVRYGGRQGLWLACGF